MPKRNNAHYRYTNTVSFFGDSIRAAALDLFTRIASVLGPVRHVADHGNSGVRI